MFGRLGAFFLCRQKRCVVHRSPMACWPAMLPSALNPDGLNCAADAPKAASLLPKASALLRASTTVSLFEFA